MFSEFLLFMVIVLLGIGYAFFCISDNVSNTSKALVLIVLLIIVATLSNALKAEFPIAIKCKTCNGLAYPVNGECRQVCKPDNDINYKLFFCETCNKTFWVKEIK